MDAPIHPHVQLAIDIERARHSIVTAIDGALWPLDASFASTRALRLVAQARGLIHAGEVGRAMGVSRQAAASLLKRHEKAGHVVAVHEGWARSVRITAAGRRHLHACMAAIPAALEALHHVPEAEIGELGDLLHRLAESLEMPHERVWLPEW